MNRMLKKRPSELKGISVKDLLMDKTVVIYVGITGIAHLGSHAYAWLQFRNPCITHADGRSIRSERKKYGFEHVELWTSTTMLNCARMEEMLHELFKDEPIGTRRCWRRAGNGSNYEDLVRPESTFKVYLAYSRTAQASITSGELKIND
jgi:hypothetical protein